MVYFYMMFFVMVFSKETDLLTFCRLNVIYTTVSS